MRRSPSVLVLLWSGIAGCVLLAACRTSKQPGELVVLVTTDLSIPKDIDKLHVNVWLAGGQSLLNKDYPLGPTGLSLPGTLGVVSGPNTTAPVTIQVLGLLKGQKRVSREVIATVPTDRVAMLPMPLDWLCIGSSCTSGETCQAGTCVSAKVPAISNDYLPASYDGGAEDGGGACFDTSACFASTELWLAPFRADCTVARPIGGAGVNVALLVAGGDGICGSGSCLIPLDAESPEGWQTSADGTRIDLPLAACTNRDVTAVEVSIACAAKRANAAICPGVSSTGSGCAVDADGGCPEGYVCESWERQTRCVLAGGPDDGGTGSPADGGTCTLDAGPRDVLVDDMSGTHQIKYDAWPGIGGTKGWWFTGGDATGSMIPAPGDFTYTAVSATATCEPPFSKAACMRSITPYSLYAFMGFNFDTFGTIPDAAPPPIGVNISSFKGIRFWARASDNGSQQLSVTFPDVSNYGGYLGAACAAPGALRCGNYHQSTQTLTSTWQPYEVNFDSLTQRLTAADGFYSTDRLNTLGAIGIEFVMNASAPDGGPAPLDGGADLRFEVCVAEIYLVPK